MNRGCKRVQPPSPEHVGDGGDAHGPSLPRCVLQRGCFLLESKKPLGYCQLLMVGKDVIFLSVEQSCNPPSRVWQFCGLALPVTVTLIGGLG